MFTSVSVRGERREREEGEREGEKEEIFRSIRFFAVAAAAAKKTFLLTRTPSPEQKKTQAWAPNARALRSLFVDLARRAKTGFGTEVRFALVDTGGGGENASSTSHSDGGRAAAALAERCGVRALPAFQIWQGGELQASLSGAEASTVVISEEEAEAEAEEQRRLRGEGGGRAERLLRSAGRLLVARLRRLTGQKKKAASAPSASLRTRLAAELRERVGAPVPAAPLLSRLVFGPMGRVYGQRWRIAAAAAALATAGAVAGSLKSSRNSERWEQGTYEWLPTEVHKKAVRAGVVAKYKQRQFELGSLHFLAPASYLLRWFSGKGGHGGAGPLGPRFPASEFADVINRPLPPMPDIDFEAQVDGDQVKKWLEDLRRLDASQRRARARRLMEDEAAALAHEAKKWDYLRAIREKEAQRAEELSAPPSSSSPSSSSSSPEGVPRARERRAILAGEVEDVPLRKTL